MHVEIDLNRCACYGNCVEAAPEVFQLSEVDDIADVILPDPGAELEDSVREAALVCPANAIIISGS